MVSNIQMVASLGLIAIFFLLAPGCGGRSDLGLVDGKVTLDGKPLADAFVEFVPKSSGSVATGRTDQNGEYSMMFSRDVKGASIGENIVRISTYDVRDEGGKEVHIPERIPTKYNSKSEQVVTVEQGRNRLDFDLKSGDGRVVQTKNIEGL